MLIWSVPLIIDPLSEPSNSGLMNCVPVRSAASAQAAWDLLLPLDEIDREAAERRLLVLRLHVGAGLSHGRDDAVQGNAAPAVAAPRERGRRDRLDRAEGVALDTGDSPHLGTRQFPSASGRRLRPSARVMESPRRCSRGGCSP